jgi:hypothetical protein
MASLVLIICALFAPYQRVDAAILEYTHSVSHPTCMQQGTISTLAKLVCFYMFTLAELECFYMFTLAEGECFCMFTIASNF